MDNGRLVGAPGVRVECAASIPFDPGRADQASWETMTNG